MNENQDFQKYQPPFGLAGLAGAGSFVLICWFIQSFASLQTIPWLADSLYLLLPIVAIFTLLYFSAWHLEWHRPMRIVWTLLTACWLYGCVILTGVFLLVFFYVALYRLGSGHF